MSNRPCPNLFVYGTLRRGFDNRFARTLSKHGTLLGAAQMQGRLYAVDSYPGMVLSEKSNEWVKGEVNKIRNPLEILPVLDEYEGCGLEDAPPFEFERVLSTAFFPGAKPVDCWVYVYRMAVTEDRRIPSGDYLTHPKPA